MGLHHLWKRPGHCSEAHGQAARQLRKESYVHGFLIAVPSTPETHSFFSELLIPKIHEAPYRLFNLYFWGVGLTWSPNGGPLYAKVAHNQLKVAQNCRSLAFQVLSSLWPPFKEHRTAEAREVRGPFKGP